MSDPVKTPPAPTRVVKDHNDPTARTGDYIMMSDGRTALIHEEVAVVRNLDPVGVGLLPSDAPAGLIYLDNRTRSPRLRAILESTKRKAREREQNAH